MVGGKTGKRKKDGWGREYRKGKLKVGGIWGVISKAVRYNIVEDSTNAWRQCKKKSWSNRVDKVSDKPFSSPNEASSTGNGLHIIDILAKGTQWESKKKKRLFSVLQSHGKALLMKTTLTFCFAHGEIKLAPPKSLHTYWLVFTAEEHTYSSCYQGRKVSTNPIYSGDLPTWCTNAIVAHSCAINQSTSDQI